MTIVPGRRCAATRSQQAALNVEIFGDGFDDPIGLGAPREIVFEIADGDAAAVAGVKNAAGRAFCAASKPARTMRLRTRGSVSVNPRAFSSGVSSEGSHVEQPTVHAGIGEVRGDSGAHGSGAEYGNSLDGWLSGGAGCHRIVVTPSGSATQQIGPGPAPVSVTERTKPVNGAGCSIPERAYSRLIEWVRISEIP